MPLDYIPTIATRNQPTAVREAIEALRSNSQIKELGDTIIYAGWPKFADYESTRHPADIAVIGPTVGVVLIRVLQTPTPRTVNEAALSISQAAASAAAQLLRSPVLRDRSRQLKVPVVAIVFAPGFSGPPSDEAELISSQGKLVRTIAAPLKTPLSRETILEARSILEGAKALMRPSRRTISQPKRQQLAIALSKLEEEIASFDQRQRQVALTVIGGPQRIRGLAGSGKTIILAMKAALAHIENPDARILITFYTRSLRDQLTRLITRFFRHFAEGEPDWKRIHVRHGWGRKDLPGVYREACSRSDIAPLSFDIASARSAPKQDPFDYACRALLETGRVRPYYDLILIDEGQDFKSGFYELCFHLAIGERDTKQIVWAYDELQDIFDVRVRTPEELFGTDTDGKPRISLSRALPDGADTNDFVLPKCYRNQRDVLVLAHAIGFGLYGTPVQMLQDREHWEDVGYEVNASDMRPGTAIKIVRPDHNSPTHLNGPSDVALVECESFDHFHDEVNYCADEFLKFIDGGLQPEDLMAIAIDDRVAQRYLSALAEALSTRGIASNNIIADRYSEPPFLIEGKCTLSTVYRAKGNEAAVVAVLGCDAVPLRSRSGRNRLFTAFTRAKGWLRITGMGDGFKTLKGEVKKAIKFAPEMRFTMPDPEQIEMIQRDLSEKDAKLQRAREEIERVRESLGLTEQEMRSLLPKRRRNGSA